MEKMKEEIENQKEIPEFYRDLKEDPDEKGLWYFFFRNNPEARRKPIQTPDNKPHKIDFQWNELFSDASKPIEIEIGSGKGGFLVEYAQKHPELSLLGSEWDKTWAVFCMERLKKKKVLDHTQMLCGDMFYFLRDAVPSNSVDAFHMYFPDPWPKRKHRRRRLVNERFPALARQALQPGGRVYLRTDDPDYFEQMVRVFGAEPAFHSVDTPAELAAQLTDFEREFLARGIKTRHAAYQAGS